MGGDAPRLPQRVLYAGSARFALGNTEIHPRESRCSVL